MAQNVCPWWFGYWLASPVRKLSLNPDVLLGPYVKAGMTILEPGPGMGFFTLPMARLVGPGGRIVAVDIQQKMLDALGRRARRAGLSDRIDLRLAGSRGMAVPDLAGRVDFALAFAMVHEVPDPGLLFREIAAALKRGGRLLFCEPTGHVRGDDFRRSLELAGQAGLREVDRPAARSWRTPGALARFALRSQHAAVLER